MTEAMPFLQKYDITFLRPPTICRGIFICWVLSEFYESTVCHERIIQTIFEEHPMSFHLLEYP